jgi:hypothetical protein
MKKGVIDWIAIVLVIIGAINWGLTVFNFNLVSTIFGTATFADVIYALVGLSGLYMICLVSKE